MRLKFSFGTYINPGFFWLTVITAARRNGRVPRRPQGRCSPRQL